MRFWVNRFGAKFAKKIQKRRVGHHSNWQWHLDEVFVKINGERFYLWRAVDHEGEVLECFVKKRRNKATAKKFLWDQALSPNKGYTLLLMLPTYARL